jgi:hypothetical protein
MSDLLAHPQTVALGWALLHSLWQLAIVAGLLASVNVLLRRSSRARYVAAGGALLLAVAIPVATFVIAKDEGSGRRSPALPGVRAAAFADEAEPAGDDASTLAAPIAFSTVPALRRAEAPAVARGAVRLRERVDAALPLIVLGWAAGVGLLSVRVLGGWVLAQRLKRSGRHVSIERGQEAAARLCRRMRIWLPVRLCESALVEVPTVIGWLRPVVLLPMSTLAGLSPVQLEALLAHELAHIRRFDYLVNLVQTFVETVLFYHPAVWWISHRMREERELCCDDAAVAVCGDPVGYARALAELEGRRALGPALAMAAGGGSLWLRVTRLLGGPPAHLPRSSRWGAGLLALGALSLLGVATGVSLEGGTPPRRSEPATVRLALADYGVSHDYVRCLAELGYENLSPGQLIALRSTGVSASFVAGLQELGYERLSVTRLIMLRSQGVTPGYVEGLAEQGYEKLSPLSLVALRSHGVTPSYVEGLKELGLEGLSVPLLIGLRSQGVDAGFAEGFQEEGYDELTPGELVLLRQNGVTSRYVSRLKAAGYDDLTTTQLIALRQSGVDPRETEEAAEEGEDEPADDKPCTEDGRHNGEEDK